MAFETFQQMLASDTAAALREAETVETNMARRSAEQVAYNAKVRSDGYKNWPYQDKPV